MNIKTGLIVRNVFNLKKYNNVDKKIETIYDHELIIQIASLKHENPEFAKQTDKLLSLLSLGEINTNGLRNALKMLEDGYITTSTMNYLLKNTQKIKSKIWFIPQIILRISASIISAL